MSQLTALKELDVGGNKFPSTEVEFIIESFPQLTYLNLQSLGLTGEHSRSTSTVLHLTNFCITDAEKARVRAALPNCRSLWLD